MAVGLGGWAERWNGKRWSIEHPPALVDRSVLFGVWCVAEAACTAVGEVLGSSPFCGCILAESWNGSGWSMYFGGRSVGEQTSGLTGVSCGSASTCTAVGRENLYQRGPALVERWNGEAWVSQRTPSSPAGLAGVSCPSTTVCTAIGDYDEFSWAMLGTFNGYGLLAERWTGNHWRIQQTPSPAGATNIGLAAVSCPSLAGCIAVGSYKPPGEHQRTLAERWTRTS
jgi:hypothetical protein